MSLHSSYVRTCSFALVVVVQVKSVETSGSGKVNYNVKLTEICKAKRGRPKKLKIGKSLSVFANQAFDQASNCLCPKLVNGRTYRVAINLRAGGKLNEVEIPKLFYLKESSSCDNSGTK